MPQVEAWLKVYVDASGSDSFLDDPIHGSASCRDCHGGAEGELTKELAHVGMVADPSDMADGSCTASCHAPQSHYFESSVHATQVGYKSLFEKRAGMPIDGHPELEEGFAADCGACHASCGDCHISQPKNVGGGLVDGHRINRTPDQTRNCTACHGSRVGDEYAGENAYAGPSAHFLNRMKCVDCHDGGEMHGTPGADPQTRYEEPAIARCDDCHADVVGQGNTWHSMHTGAGAESQGRSLQCQVCHAQDYKSCNSCHVGEGITGSSYQTFKIGRNPLQGLNGYDYAVLRHIPVSEDTFTGWGLTELPNYSSVETWKYTSPHNVKRFTARTDNSGALDGCENCHATEDSPQGFFLRASDLAGLPQAEQDANQNVIVPEGDATTWPE